MILQNAISSALSIDRGRRRFALGFVDELCSIAIVLVVLIEAGWQVGIVANLTVLAVAARRLDRALHAGDEVAQHLFGDEQRVLELGDSLGRGLEHDDLVRALTVAIDRVRQPAPAPWRDLHDLATSSDDLGGRSVDEGLTLVV